MTDCQLLTTGGKHPVVIVSKTEMKYGKMSKMKFIKNEIKKDQEVIDMKNELNKKMNILFLQLICVS